jgi:hypothetical protein
MFLKGKKKIKHPFFGALHHVMSLEQDILEIPLPWMGAYFNNTSTPWALLYTLVT